MKKLMSILLAVLILVSIFVSCNGDDSTTTDYVTTTEAPNTNNIPIISDEDSRYYLSLICETDSGSEGSLNHKNIINTNTVTYIDENVPSKKSIKISSVEKELAYKSTLYYPLYDMTLHGYGEDDEKVLLDESGSIAFILHGFTFLDIDKRAKPEEILPQLKNVLKEYIDITQYKNIMMPNDRSYVEGGFDSYHFLFYKTVDGYMTDWITAFVKDDGGVYAFRIVNKKCNIASLNIDKDLEAALIELKFKDMCTTENTEYVSYKLEDMGYPPEVVAIEGTVYIKYSGSAEYLIKNEDIKMRTYLQDILIPVELITSK